MDETVDYVIRGQLVNVLTGRMEKTAVAVQNDRVVALEERPARTILEANYITPGLIDAHVHVESSMVTIPRYGEAVIPRGVTSVIHDPHELTNVLGEEGFRAALEDAKHTPLKVRFGVPSSVPASNLQDAGAKLGSDAVDRCLDLENVAALAEVMNVGGVIGGDPEVHAKIRSARERNLTVDGHLPRVGGSALQEAARFLDNDHENISLEEAREKYRCGIRVYMRLGTTSRNLPDLLPLVDEVNPRFLSLCSDDRNVVDLVEQGGVDYALKRVLQEGVDPVVALQMATLNTAESYNLPFGRIKPGAPADLVLLEDLNSWEVQHVMVDGILDPTETAEEPPPSKLDRGTVRFEPLDEQDLIHPAPNGASGTRRVRVIDADELQTGSMVAQVPCREGGLMANLKEDVLPLAVVERHGQKGGIGTGFVHRLGLRRGAVACTVAHDAHNLVVAGVSHRDMARAANHLRTIDGGFAVYDPEPDEVTAVSLPVAGLMSDRSLLEVAEGFKAVEQAARELGLRVPGGVMELTFLSLEVVPELRLTNRGLVDVTRMEYVDVLLDD